MSLWLAKGDGRTTIAANDNTTWGTTCLPHSVSKGFVKRQMLTLVGQVEWKRKGVRTCPHLMPGHQQTPPDDALASLPIVKHPPD